MFFAKVTDLNCGLDNGKALKSKGYKVGDVLTVASVNMSASHTNITMDNGEKYNSIHFEFFRDKECTQEYDIYSDPLYNKIIRG